ncbi:retinol dehydrogenase 11-like [Pieris napi]|uniref:retinol dehydrogenase 11-like n=1 Tax=Pieris napi TaxID=78633 RepID=UPI001FBAB305|nr:retinol dehydrogenase 11-like [Pieris napi]
MLGLIYFIFITSIVAVLVGLWQKNTNVLCKSKKNLEGKTAIVTGGTSGMGLRIATDFASRGAKVIVACPFIDEGTNGRKHIIERTGNEKVIFKLLDLSSITSIRKFSSEILQTEERLDILVNNAGVGIGFDYLTKDGMNFIMQVNYFGSFLLTILLLPLLLKTGKPGEPARIVNTSSVLHNIGVVDFTNINRLNYWYGIQCYGNSKLCLVLFAHELTKRLNNKNVVINCVDPGAVGTPIFNCVGWFLGGIITYFFKNFFKTPWEGAQTAIHVALDKKAGEVSGQFFKNCKLSRAKQAGYDDKIAVQLWEESIRLVKMDQDEVYQCLQPLS